MARNNILGVDLGGTNARAGVVRNQQLGEVSSIQINPHGSTEEVLDHLCGLIDRTPIARIVYGASGSQTRKVYGREYRGIPSKELFQRIKPSLIVVGPVFEVEGLKIHAESMRGARR